MEDRRNICFVHLRKPSGGTYSVLKNQLEMFLNLDNFNIFYLGSYSSEIDNLFNDKSKLFFIKYKDTILYSFINFFTIVKIRKFIRKNKIKIIYLFGLFRDYKNLYLGLNNLKCEIILRVDAYVWRKRNSLIDIFFIKKINKWVTVCNSMVNNIIEYFPSIDKKRIFVLYNFIDTEIYKKDLNNQFLKNELNIRNDYIIITHSARIIPTKMQKETLLVFNKLKDIFKNIFLIIKGVIIDKNYYNQIVDFIEEYKIDKVKIIIEERPSVREILNITDIFIFPSESETISIAVQEAMSFSLPVICSNVGGMNELIEDGYNGFFIQNNNLNEMYDLLQKLIKDKQLRETIGLNARRTIEEKFSKNKLEKIYINFFNQ